MIKLKPLLTESAETISPKMVFNFYYLWHLFTTEPNIFRSAYGKEILNSYTKNFQIECIRRFKRLVYEQLLKYVKRGRIDADFPQGRPLENSSAEELFLLMKKTFRSDMTRRNERWETIAEAVKKLENAHSPSEIFIWINQLFNATHNTDTKIIDKFFNAHELFQAFNIISKHDPKYWKQYTDSDIRGLLDQGDEESLMESEVDKGSVAYKSGIKMALRDKLTNTNRKINGLPPDFVAGYNSIRRTSTWDKLNNRLTQLAAAFGRSYGKR